MPSVVEQAQGIGARISWIDRTKLLPDAYHYNASIVGDRLFYRSETAFVSSIGACRLADGQPIGESTRIELPRFAPDGADSYEDPRAIECAGETWLSYVHFMRRSISIQFARLDDELLVAEHIVPSHGGNFAGKVQKNWAPFEHEGELHFIYLSAPEHEVVRLRDERLVARTPGVTWAHGTVRGGTPPILVGDRYLTFFHSRGNRVPGDRWRYYMGAYTFAAEPPFAPIAMTPKPLLVGSGRDPQLERLPLVVFPNGAVRLMGGWRVSLGVNDVGIALLSISDEALAAQMRPL